MPSPGLNSLNPTERRNNVIVIIALLLLGVFYTAVAVHFAHYRSFWSTDSGVRYAMVRSWLERGDALHLPYIWADLDPQARINPLGKMHVVPTRKGLAAIYPPIFPLLSVLPYRLWGLAGLAFWPILSGVGAALADYAAASRLKLRTRLALVPVVGLATPLPLYSVVFWDHAVFMALSALFVYTAIRAIQSSSTRWAVASGAVLGVGLWFHGLFLVLLVAALIACPWTWLPGRERRLFGWMLAGFVPLALGWACQNLLLYGTLGGAHGAATVNEGYGSGIKAVVSAGRFWMRTKLQVFGNSGPPAILSRFILVVAAFAAASRLPARWSWLKHALAILAALGSFVLVRNAGLAHGLFEATPLFLLAAGLYLPKPELDQDPDARLYLWMGRTCLAFYVLVILSPGRTDLDWGSRFLLMLLPFLILMGAKALERDWSVSAGWQRGLTAGAAACLLAASLYSQQKGLTAIKDDLMYSRQINLAVAAARGSALGFGTWWVGPETTITPEARPRFWVDADERSRRLFFSALDRMGADSFSFLGDDTDLSILSWAAAREPRPYRPVRQESRCGFILAEFRRAPHGDVEKQIAGVHSNPAQPR